MAFPKLKIFLTVLLFTSIWATYSHKTDAIKLADGTVHFAKGPELLSPTTTFNDAGFWSATYFFTIKVPENAGEPLQRVTIAQIEGVDNIRYRLKETYAFEGNRHKEGKKISIRKVELNQNNNTLNVVFEPPISPGKTVTVALRPVQNPFSSGVYLFGVTAYPAGEKAYGLYLGVGRLHFYRFN